MTSIKEILSSKRKPKEKVTQLIEAMQQKDVSINEFIRYFKSASNVDKGTCADAMKHISNDVPGTLAPYIPELIGYINYDVPRVKWGIPEAIGNMARQYPGEVESAIPKLLVNTKDASTVVRWCAAYALTEVFKYNKKSQKFLTPKIKDILKRETNNGVKNVYLKVIGKA